MTSNTPIKKKYGVSVTMLVGIAESLFFIALVLTAKARIE